jgi:hypothetical protein
VEWLSELQRQVHGRARESFSLMVTTGSQDALAMARVPVCVCALAVPLIPPAL